MSRRRLRSTSQPLLATKTVTVTWVPTTIDAQGGAVTLTDARVYWDTVSRSPGLGYANSSLVGGTTASKTLNNLYQLTTYYFAVVEIDSAGNSYVSQEFTFTTAA